MTKYITFLRGINVGGNKKVPMAKLKKIFEDIGYMNVSTYINSGNVIFESKETLSETSISHIEAKIKESFGFESKIVVRSSKEIKKLLDAIPTNWQNNDEQKTDVIFLWPEFDNKKTLDLIAQTEIVDNLLYTKGAIIWNIDRKHYAKSGMHKFIGTTVYKNMTARNVNTVRKIVELLGIN